ncbi:MAG: hypothetical protein IJX36_04365 [Thermoguttaceae bacterium]|nr:hypothetical protein [Thermoguttaceae bacterium]MBQ8363146.1 hypothetical protein [Thermoguttaceae bacterium]MBQ9126548.1 hypothetical protein [Thermoguttaceae bacterium]
MTRKTKLAGVAAALFAVPFAPLWADAPKSPPSSPPVPTSQTSATAPEPGEIRVVYPSSATSNEPIVFEPRDVVPPRSESRDAPFGSDVETPIGQVRAVLATLNELRRTQAALDVKLDALASAPAPSLDPAVLTGPLETLSQRLDAQIAALETSVQTAFAQTLETALSDALPPTLATDLQTLDGKLDAILEAESTPSEPQIAAPPGWNLVRFLTLATCVVVLGSVAVRGAFALWRAGVKRREQEFAARLAAYNAEQNAAASTSRKSKSSAPTV